MKHFTAFTIFNIFSLTFVFCAITKKVVRLDRYDMCELPRNTSIIVDNWQVKRAGYGSVVDGTFHLQRDVAAFRTTSHITRCKNKEQLDSCEFFGSIPIDNSCSFIAAKNTLMSPMTYAHTPPLICPLLKGTYILKNGTFSADLVSIFPLENFYWKVNMFVYEVGTDEFLYKMCIEGQIVAYRE